MIALCAGQDCGRRRTTGAAISNIPVLQAELRRQSGVTLPIVLALTALLQLLAIAQADTALIALRTAGARHDRLTAFVAADSGLVLCSRLLAQGVASVRPWTEPGEPAYWRSGVAFGGSSPAAFVLQASWPGTTGALRCLIESRALAPQVHDETERYVYLLTAHALGVHTGTQSYAQAIAFDPDPGSGSATLPQARGWRSVAAVPAD